MSHHCTDARTDRSRLLAIAACLIAGLPLAGRVYAQGAVAVEKITYQGWKNALKIANGDAEVIVTLDVGPRIVSYKLKGGENVFKQYADQLGKTGEKSWQIRGGHRLWVAPEDVERTYAADNGPISYEVETSGAIRFVQPPDAFGIKKTMAVKLAPQGSEVTILHTIENAGKEATELAPWALTVMNPGGTEIIPQPPHAPHPGASGGAQNPEDFLPNQTLVLWPYFKFTDPRWSFGEKYILMRHGQSGPTKIGTANSPGWAAYANGGMLFVKYFDFERGARYPDRGVNYETFTNEEMVEMESLGPLVKLGPGESVGHTERWRLFELNGPVESEADADRLVLPKVK